MNRYTRIHYEASIVIIISHEHEVIIINSENGMRN